MNGRAVIPAPARADVKERPILFSAPMVRALLDGSKTQTRRIFKPERIRITEVAGWFRYSTHKRDGSMTGGGQFIPDGWLHYCPYGQPDDRLWVRETFQGPLFDDMDAYRAEPDDFKKPEFCEYAADGGGAPEFMTMDDELVCRWRPSIHMPRWASRILLEIVSVRVERLNDISKADAIAEGLICYPHEWRDCEYPLPDVAYEPFAGSPTRYSDPVQAYKALWESINGAGAWGTNPWCWALEFRRVAT